VTLWHSIHYTANQIAELNIIFCEEKDLISVFLIEGQEGVPFLTIVWIGQFERDFRAVIKYHPPGGHPMRFKGFSSLYVIEISRSREPRGQQQFRQLGGNHGKRLEAS
jgi:hypothetical protein